MEHGLTKRSPMASLGRTAGLRVPPHCSGVPPFQGTRHVKGKMRRNDLSAREEQSQPVQKTASVIP